MIPPSFVHDLLSRADIVEVIGRHVPLRKAGANHKGLCPFHAEKSPSFIVSPSRQTYHCFGCGVHGNAVGFLMEHAGMGFVDAVHELAQQNGMAVADEAVSAEEHERQAALKRTRSTLSEVLAKAAEHYRRALKAAPRAIEYLAHRGVSTAVAERFGLGYASDSWRGLASAFASYDDPLLEASGLVVTRQAEAGDFGDAKRYDRFRDRIMFPIRSVQGDIIGFGGRILDRGEPKYLNSPETAVFSKGRELYGLFEARSAIRERGYALVVEGYMDVVALAEAGLANAVASLGTAFTAEHIQKLFRFTDSVVFSFDGDTAGHRAAARALEAAAPLATDTRSVRFLFLPEEHDPDSFIRAMGADAFARCVGEAVPLSRQIIEQGREGCRVDTAEGRARFLANVRPIWQSLPDGALKRQLLPELAHAGGLAPADLAELWLPKASNKTSDRMPTSRRAAGTIHADTAPSAAGTSLHRPSRGSAQRVAPSIPADHALRMLLLHSGWWDRLGHDDHELLHALPPPHGAVFAWLERYLADQGPAAWAVLEQALTQEPFDSEVRVRMPAAVFDDEMDFAELRRIVDGLWVERLASRQKALIDSAASDPKALQQWREVELERQARLTRMRRTTENRSAPAQSG